MKFNERFKSFLFLFLQKDTYFYILFFGMSVTIFLHTLTKVGVDIPIMFYYYLIWIMIVGFLGSVPRLCIGFLEYIKAEREDHQKLLKKK